MNFSLTDFTKLHFSAQSVIVGILFMMPMWFVSIYLYHKTFFEHQPIYLVIMFSFVFSLIWITLNLLLSFILLIVIAGKIESDNILFGCGVLLSISIFGVHTYSEYTLNVHQGFKHFLTELQQFYFFMLIFFILALILMQTYRAIFKSIQKKKNKQLEIEFPN